MTCWTRRDDGFKRWPRWVADIRTSCIRLLGRPEKKGEESFLQLTFEHAITEARLERRALRSERARHLVDRFFIRCGVCASSIKDTLTLSEGNFRRKHFSMTNAPYADSQARAATTIAATPVSSW
jgi:hypothetical protein